MKAIEFDEEVLRQLFNDGTPVEAMAQHFGCSRSPVARAISSLGLSRQRLRPGEVALDDDEVRRLFAEGMSLEKMAAQLGCGNTRAAKSVRRLGLTRPPLRKGMLGAANPQWRGGRWIFGGGYVCVRVGADYPVADADGRIFEHRLVMQRALGRPLRDGEIVLLVNGVKTDNRLDNLAIMSRTEHSQHHHRLARMARASRDGSREPAAGSSEAVAC